MIIHVPVYMECDGHNIGGSYYPRPKIHANFVIRIDTDDDSRPIEYAKVYGPKIKLRFQTDDGDVFAMVFEGTQYRKLIERAKANPADYCADPIEGIRLQDIADATRRTV